MVLSICSGGGDVVYGRVEAQGGVERIKVGRGSLDENRNSRARCKKCDRCITNTLYSCNVNDHYFPHQNKFSLAFKT